MLCLRCKKTLLPPDLSYSLRNSALNFIFSNLLKFEENNYQECQNLTKMIFWESDLGFEISGLWGPNTHHTQFRQTRIAI
jgi:hypothetical protein